MATKPAKQGRAMAANTLTAQQWYENLITQRVQSAQKNKSK